MFRLLAGFGLGYLVLTKDGRNIGKNICVNMLPYIEKELGLNITEPLKRLTKTPSKKEKTHND